MGQSANKFVCHHHRLANEFAFSQLIAAKKTAVCLDHNSPNRYLYHLGMISFSSNSNISILGQQMSSYQDPRGLLLLRVRAAGAQQRPRA